MFSFETEDRITKLLLYIGDCNKHIDISKKELNTHLDFEPFQVFTRLDKCFKGHIDYMDILNCFKENMIYCTADEARLIIMWYDYNNDSLLTYGEFMNLILAKETRNFENKNFNANCRDVRSTTLMFDLEQMLCDILEKELRFNRMVRELIMNCRCRFDFDIGKAFKALSGNGIAITKESLRLFLLRNKREFTESDVDNIMLRLDLEKRGRVGYKEIEKIFLFDTALTTDNVNDTHTKYCDDRCCYTNMNINNTHTNDEWCSKCKKRKLPPFMQQQQQQQQQQCVHQDKPNVNMDINNSQSQNNINNTNTSNINGSYADIKRKQITNSITKQLNLTIHTLTGTPRSKSEQDTMIQHSQSPSQIHNNILKTNNNNNTSNNTQHTLPSNAKNINNGIFNPKPFPKITSSSSLLLDLFELIYQTENELEQIKSKLALRNDFNVDDAFRLFENKTSPQNTLTEYDMFTGLNTLGLYPTGNEIKLLIKRYSLQNTCTLNFADLFDMLVPFDKDYRKAVESRNPSPYIPKYNCGDLFLGETKRILGEVFEKMIISENKIELLRKRISKSYGINVREFVMSIDNEQKGFINCEDLRQLYKEKVLKNKSTYTNDIYDDKEVDLCFIRFDRDRDGKVSYDDVINETCEFYF